MRIGRIAIGLAALALSAHLLLAQQPEQRPGQPSDSMMGMSGTMRQHMRTMDSLNARLDTLVSRMNRATGNKRMAAMADVINELVAQRKAMQKHMREMMQPGGGMRMPRTGAPAPADARRPTAETDSAVHGQHHPPN